MPDLPAIRALPRTFSVEVLTPEDLERVHHETLGLLERVGVGLTAPRLADDLVAAGAKVDAGGQRVRFPAAMVEETLGRDGGPALLAARRPAADLHLDGRQGYLSVDGCAAEIIDPENGSRRPSTKRDLATAARLADALPEIGLLWQPVAARDVPVAVKPLHEVHAQLTNTSKHIQVMTAVTPEAAKGVVEIARMVAGGEEELRRRPLISAFQCSLSPLSYEDGALEAAVVFARAGVPCGFVVMPIACATGPATVAGTLVQANAEILAGVVALRALSPGAVSFYGSCATVMDLRTGAAACGGPEDLFFQMATAQLARRYGLPSLVGTFATGAKTPDWQAGMENGLSGLSSCLAGADILAGAGLLAGASVFSLEEMVLDCEIFSLLHHLVTAASPRWDDGSMATLEAVGPGGHFLGQRHTLQTMRRQWMPRIFDRTGWEEWEEKGRPGPREAARERVRQLLDQHVPMPLEDGLEAEILAIIEAYERQEGDRRHE
jgi:trimethylamine--corrinoid protein Co-methyltransferase